MAQANTNCGYFDRGECRSCTALSWPESERASRKEIEFEALARQVLPGVVIAPLWRPTKLFHSRTKAKLMVSGSMTQPVVGLVDRERSSTELLDCPLHVPELNRLLHRLKSLITEHKIAPYHIERRQGELKSFILKSDESGAQVIVRFVLRSQDALSKVKRAARELQKEFASIKVVSVNIQPLPAAVLEGEEEIFLTENRVIWESFDGVKLAFQPQSFSQVTHETAEALYRQAKTILTSTGSRSLLDLFCGVGGFSLVSASALEWGHGVELSERAIDSAGLACAENGIGNLKFESGDVEKFLDDYAGPLPDAVLFNPPRRGLSPAMIERVKRLGTRRVIYSSCNPATLLRDLSAFAPDYTVKQLWPFDMFPLTEHLEVLALLER